MTSSCETCHHWRPARSLARIEDRTIGECHATTPARDFTWPKTKATDHCGQHAAKIAFAQAPAAPSTETAPAQLPLGLGAAKRSGRGKVAP